MAVFTLAQLRTNIGSTVRDTQITTLIDDFINFTWMELHSYHPWTWKRRKQTFETVVSQEDYNLDEEVDEIALLRQISTPTRLRYLPDWLFYKNIPDPENQSTGPPRIYRRWEETGFFTNLAAADTIYVSSSSTSDGSGFKVVVTGRNSSGEIITESLTLNGTTSVTSSTTFAASGLMRVSKSATTTGTITVYRTTGATVLSEIAPSEITPRYKRISLYPVPSAAVTMYLEYFETFRPLLNDNDVPSLPVKWNWVLREGTLAKAWEYKQSEVLSAQHQALYDRGLKLMVRQDEMNQDYIPVLQPRVYLSDATVVRYSDSVADAFPVYGLVV